LSNRGAGYDVIECQRHFLRAETELARLVLVDLDPHDSCWFRPVEVEVADPRNRPQLVRNLQRDRVHARKVRSAHAVFHGPANGWDEFKGRKSGNRRWE